MINLHKLTEVFYVLLQSLLQQRVQPLRQMLPTRRARRVPLQVLRTAEEMPVRASQVSLRARPRQRWRVPLQLHVLSQTERLRRRLRLRRQVLRLIRFNFAFSYLMFISKNGSRRASVFYCSARSLPRFSSTRKRAHMLYARVFIYDKEEEKAYILPGL